MQVMPTNNLAFKSYICNHYSETNKGHIRSNDWDNLVKEARQSGQFTQLNEVLGNIYNNGDDNILAFERHCSGDDFKNTWSIALYKNEDDIVGDRSYLTKELRSVNQNAIVIDEYEDSKNPQRSGYYVRDLEGRAITRNCYGTKLNAVISVLSQLSDKSSDYFKRLTSDLYTEPRTYLNRFAKKAVK